MAAADHTAADAALPQPGAVAIEELAANQGAHAVGDLKREDDHAICWVLMVNSFRISEG